MERDPRRRYATAADMAWELEHQEQVAVDDGVRRPTLRRIRLPEARRMMLYAGLALVPVVLFGLMLMMAGK